MKVLFVSAKNYPEFPKITKKNSFEGFYKNIDLDDLSDTFDKIKPNILFLAGFEPSDHTLLVINRLLKDDPKIEVVIFTENPSPSFVMKVMRTGIREILEDMEIYSVEEALDRIATRLNGDVVADSKKVSAFMSAKGGDGATCLVANYAAALAEHSQNSVVVIDLSLPFGDLEMFLTNQKPSFDLADFSDEIDRLDKSLINSMILKIKDNLHLIPSPSSIDKIIRIKPEHIDSLIDILSKNYDYVLIDIGAGIDPISIHALAKLDKLVIVATTTIPSFKRATQIVSYWKELGFELKKLSLVINRSEGVSDVKFEDFGKATGLIIEKIFPKDFDGVQESLLKGTPLIKLHSKSPYSRAIRSWVKSLTTDNQIKEKSFWQRLLNK